MKRVILTLSLLTGLFNETALGANKYYMPNAHSHNDYFQEKPLIQAIQNGMSSIEADVWLREDEEGAPRLYVAHDEDEITPERTLEEMYLKPLAKWVRDNDGVVYNTSEERVFLHVDLKTTDRETWKELQKTAGRYGDIFTQYLPDGSIKEGAVTIFTNADYSDHDEVRYSTGDGRFGDIYSEENWDNYFTNSSVTPIVSSGLWKYNDPEKAFTFRDREVWSRVIEEYNTSVGADGRIDEVSEEGASLALSRNYGLLYDYLEDDRVEFSSYFKERIRQANKIGEEHDVLIRFWNSPDNEYMWELLKPLKNVMINTGNLEELREFIEG